MIIAAIVVVVGGVVAGAVALTSGDDKGGGDKRSSRSDDASVAEFCEAYSSIASRMLDGIDLAASPEEQSAHAVEALRDWAAALDEIGAPDAMPDEARDGLEVVVETASELEPGDLQDLSDLESLQEDFSDAEQSAVQALEDYTTEHCNASIDDLPTGLPSDLPTGLPSDLPTTLPSDLPTDFLTDLPSDFLTMIPSDYLTMIPSDYLTMIPSDFLTMIPTQ